jgi:hypothetical protein
MQVNALLMSYEGHPLDEEIFSRSEWWVLETATIRP